MHIQPHFFHDILPYVKLFKNKIFVIKFSGDLCEDAVVRSHLAEQIALLHFLGMKIVVVHGGGKQATDLAKKLNIASQFVVGRRITSLSMLEVVKMSFAGQLNTDMVAQFKKSGVAAVGLSGMDGHLITAVKRPPVEVMDPEKGKITVDYGYVADIETVNVQLLHVLMDKGYLPVICSLVTDDMGQVLNVNADTLATQVAIHLHAEKLCLLTQVDGVMANVNDPDTLFSLLTISEVELLLAGKEVTGGMTPKLTNAILALEKSIGAVHIINGKTQDALWQEIFTNEGMGTMIVKNKAIF